MNQTKYLTLQDTVKKLSAIILFIVLARYLTIEDFAKYQQLLLIIGVFVIVFNMGMPIAISYFHGQASSLREKVSIYKRFFITQIFFIIIGIIFYLFIDKLIAHLFHNDYFTSFAFLVSMLIFTNTSVEIFKNIATVTNNLKNFLIITSTLQLMTIAISLIIIMITKDIYYLLLITVGFNLILFILLVKNNLKYFMVKTKKIFITTIESKYILAMGSVAFVGVFNGYVDQIMVSIMLSTEDYANLRIGAFQIPFIGIVTGSLLTVMIPIISKNYKKNDYKKIVEIWVLSIKKATVLLIPIIVFCLVFANEIIIDFFGDKFVGAVIVFQIYMLQWLRAVVIFGGVMGAIGLEKELFKNTLLITFLNILLNYILIIKVGVIGAAIATTFLNYFAAILLILKIDKTLQYKFFGYFPYKTYFISLFISLFLAIVLQYIFKGYASSIFSLISIAVLFYVIVVLLQMKLFYTKVSLSKLKELI